MAEGFKAMLASPEAEVLEPMIDTGWQDEEDFQALDRLSDEMVRRHKEEGIL